MGWKRMVASVALLGAVGLTACSGEGSSGGGGGSNSAGGTGAVRSDARVLDQSDVHASAAAPSRSTAMAFQPAGDLPVVGPSIIKTGRLEIEVRRGAFQESVQEVVALAQRLDGFVLSTSVSSEDKGFGTIVIRVPADEFETAVGDLKEIGDASHEEISGKDVTEEFIDLGARLRNLRAQEAVLLKLMDRATTIGQTIRVEGELSDVQLGIESLRGRLRFLRDRTELSTISVSLHQVGATPAGSGTLGRAWHKSTDAFLGVVSGVIVGVGFFVPLGLLALLAFFALRPLAARLSSRTAA